MPDQTLQQRLGLTAIELDKIANGDWCSPGLKKVAAALRAEMPIPEPTEAGTLVRNDYATYVRTNLNSGGMRWLNLTNGSWWTWPNISQPVRVIPASAAPEALADMFRTHGQEPRR